MLLDKIRFRWSVNRPFPFEAGRTSVPKCAGQRLQRVHNGEIAACFAVVTDSVGLEGRPKTRGGSRDKRNGYIAAMSRSQQWEGSPWQATA